MATQGTLNAEQYRYFYIDRKLGSGNLSQIAEALDEIDLFLDKMQKIDLINSIIMRLLELLQTARFFHIKERVAAIFKHHSKILIEVHSKDQIAAILARCLKGSDEYTRIVSIQMVQTLSPLFLRDIAIYHTLLSKLSIQNNFSLQQKRQSIICLTVLLSSSRQLSKLFSKNITQLQQLYLIPLHLIIYLLTFVIVDSHLQQQILLQISLLVGSFEIGKNQKKEIYYFERLVIKYAKSNYRIMKLYDSKLIDTIPLIVPLINKIKMEKYPFLKYGNCQDNINKEFVSIDQFIDHLYTLKKQGIKVSEYQQKIHSLLSQTLTNKPQQFHQGILLLYFIEDNISFYDRIIKKIIENKPKIQIAKTFKMLAVVGCYHSALSLLQNLNISQTNYIFLRVYLEFKCESNSSKLQQLIQISQILNNDLKILVSCWSLLQNICQITAKNSGSQQIYTNVKQISLLLSSIQQTAYMSEVKIIELVLQQLTNKNSVKTSLKYSYLLPSSCQKVAHYRFAYLGKAAILSLTHDG